MAWMMDQYSKIVGKNQFGVITGKPVGLGGSPGREDATARGGLYVLREAAKECGLDLSSATVAIQGYGNAGYHAASLACRLFGCKIVAISDSQGGIYNDGLVPERVLSIRRKRSVINCLERHPTRNCCFGSISFCPENVIMKTPRHQAKIVLAYNG